MKKLSRIEEERVNKILNELHEICCVYKVIGKFQLLTLPENWGKEQNHF